MKLIRSLLAIGLVGCWASAGFASTAAAAPRLTIGPDNMRAVASLGATLVSMNLAFHPADAAGRPTAWSLPASAPPNLTGLSLALLTRVLGNQPRAPDAPAVTRWPCQQGGYLRVVASPRAPRASQPRPGDRLTLHLDRCDEFGTPMSGSVAYTLQRYSGDLNDTGHARVRLDYHQLAFATPTGSTRVSGRAHADISAGDSATEVDFRASRLDYTLVRGGTAARLGIIRQRLQFTIDEDAGTVTHMVGDARFRFPALVGGFTVSTPTPLVASADGAVRAGTVALRGARGTLYLSYPDRDRVRLELDRNDDGTIDATRNTTPAELEAHHWRHR